MRHSHTKKIPKTYSERPMAMLRCRFPWSPATLFTGYINIHLYILSKNKKESRLRLYNMRVQNVSCAM